MGVVSAKGATPGKPREERDSWKGGGQSMFCMLWKLRWFDIEKNVSAHLITRRSLVALKVA